jgi:hypothetical protein
MRGEAIALIKAEMSLTLNMEEKNAANDTGSYQELLDI